MIAIEPLGDRALLARFADESAAARWAAAARELGLPGVVDVVAAYRTAAVYLDPDRDADDLEALAGTLSRLDPGDDNLGPVRRIALPVLYDGPDLESAASALGLRAEGLVERHAGREYQVVAIGFLPGFPYAGYLPDELSGLPRRPSPRVRVPAGSVAIAGRQTGIYPAESPGGWHLLGRTPLRIVDLARAFFPIRAGDRLRFEPIDAPAFEALRGADLCPDDPST